MSRPAGEQRATLGNSYDRRRRREWMIETFGVPRKKDGRKTRIRCFHCFKLMRAEPVKKDKKGIGPSLVHSWEVDRFPVCGHNGGTYRRGNVVPSCLKCNATRCHPIAGGKCRKGVPSSYRRIYAKRVAAA